jgi:hypothetical protein
MDGWMHIYGLHIYLARTSAVLEMVPAWKSKEGIHMAKFAA